MKPHSLRVGVGQWMEEENFSELIRILKKYPAGIGRVSLFANEVHTPMKLDAMKKRAAIMKERIAVLQAEGFAAGVNILSTIGHHNDFNDNSFIGDYHHMTNDMGEVCQGSYCMNDDRYLHDYVKPLYEIIASTGAEHIWIDDDIRFGHLPIGNGCFCDCCIRSFNETNSTSFTRDSLRDALDTGDIELRKKWHSFGAMRVAKILRLIGNAVRSVDPTIKAGFMTGERCFEGYDFYGWSEALSDGGKYEIMWRPGGGAYCDYNFDEIIAKSEQIGRQNANLPSYVTVINSEQENYPYQSIRKTPTSTALESAMMMTVGCTGSALNILPDPITDAEKYLKAVDKLMPFYRLLSEKTAGRQPSGICAGWRGDDVVSVPTNRWSHSGGSMYSEFAREIFDFGLPQCFKTANASVRIMRGNFAAAWTDAEITKLLSGGVMLDADAVEYLVSRGFTDLIGTTKGAYHKGDESAEVYLEHPINEGFFGKTRSAGFLNSREASGIVPVSDRSEIISALISSDGTDPCSLALYENDLGGRVVSAGFSPFAYIGDRYKSTQLKRIFRRLSGNTLPSYVETFCRIRNHTFVDGDKITVALINPTNEDLEEVRVAIRSDKRSAKVWNQDCIEKNIPSEEGENGYRVVTVPSVPAYEITLIEI